jgi:acylpyruvate hydrolase
MSAVTVERLVQSLYSKAHKKILCVGKNYALHIQEMNSEVPKKPVIFDKPLSSLLKSSEVLYLPR